MVHTDIRVGEQAACASRKMCKKTVCVEGDVDKTEDMLHVRRAGRKNCVCVCVADIIYRIDEVPCVVMWCLFGVCFSKCS